MIANKSVAERIRIGKGIEYEIFNALKLRLPKSLHLEPASDSEDKHLKIDAWVKHDQMGKCGMQIKFRESGNDILFEICKTVIPWEHGRDFTCNSQFYCVYDRKNTAWLYRINKIKQMAIILEEKAKLSFEVNPLIRRWNTNTYDLRIIEDPHTHIDKLIVFFPPTAFEYLAKYERLL